VLVLDEATSALDNETEQRIVEELNAMRGARTLIVIAHRLSTVRRCERLCLLDRGRMVASGTYDELLNSNAGFRRLASETASANRS
jgi:ABC-type multidrug transport system fused ATPase/permease subunit